MQIIFHSHHASVSDRLRLRAERGVRKLATRLGGAVDAIVRFEGDGPVRRVEIVMHASRHRELFAEGTARYLGPALAQALSGLTQQIDRARRIRSKAQRRRAALKAQIA